MAHGLDVVAIWVAYKCPVVVRMILRAQARFAVVLPTSTNRCDKERINGCAIVCAKREMQRWALRVTIFDPETRARDAIAANARTVGELRWHYVQQRRAQRREGCVIEEFRTRPIAHADTGMVNHARVIFAVARAYASAQGPCQPSPPSRRAKLWRPKKSRWP